MEGAVFFLIIFFGAFLFILIMMCCLRIIVYLRDLDLTYLCFKRKRADQRRRRIQLSLLPETLNCPANLGYTAAPDENINEVTICQHYVYEDGRSTGMSMIANLPISRAFTRHSGIPADAIFGMFSPLSLSPRLSRRQEMVRYVDDQPPPNYADAQNNSKPEGEEEVEPEQPPPSYEECMRTYSTTVP